MADRVLHPVGDVAGHWRDRITGVCERLRDALLSHTDGAGLVSASFAAGQSQVMTEVLAQLGGAATEAGVDPGQSRAGGTDRGRTDGMRQGFTGRTVGVRDGSKRPVRIRAAAARYRGRLLRRDCNQRGKDEMC